MKTLYLDIFSGISGDMFIGALLDLGVPFEKLERELSKLGLLDFHLHAARKHKSSIEGVKFDVHTHDHDHKHGEHEDEHEHRHEHGHGHDHEHGHAQMHRHGTELHTHEHGHHSQKHGRTYREIRELINRSALSPWVKEKSNAVFARIARAEGKIHGKPAEEVHFHEVGAVDSIVDIVGGCIGLELLGKPRVVAASVVEGTGFIQCAHGRFPIPAPATIAIFAERGVSISQCEEGHELVTPTGAAILAEFAEEFGLMRDMISEKIGYGLGERENKTRPNVLRAVLGRSGASDGENHDWETDAIAVLETNLDDINAEILGHVVEKSFSQGALDVFHTPVQMKKNRPGVILTILCAVADQDRFTELLLRETTALGVRRSQCERRKLKREIVSVKTEFGAVEIKVGRLDGRVIQVSPEYESCRRVAETEDMPIKQVYQAAQTAAATLHENARTP
jgi:uncharacterized protein (TIGR00299 family) protein